MKHEIQHMIADRAISIERAIQEERRVQHRSDCMTEMLDEGLPSFEVGINENGKEVVVLKSAAKGAALGHDSRDEYGVRERAQSRFIHGVVILH